MALIDPKAVEERLAIKTPTEDGKIWHDAACHCHAVEYKILFAPLYPPYSGSNLAGPRDADKSRFVKGEPPCVIRCNCSICLKNGYINIYPERSDVVFTKGYDTLKSYEFATNSRDHKFCPNCGSSLLIDFRGKMHNTMAINARMIKDFNEDKIAYLKMDGRSNFNPEFNNKFM